jgi:hypothetical protein
MVRTMLSKPENGMLLLQRVLKTEAPDERGLPDPPVRRHNRRIRSVWTRKLGHAWWPGAFLGGRSATGAGDERVQQTGHLL